MATINRNKRKTTRKKPFDVIDPDEVDDGKDSYFIKKNNEAKAFLRKVGLPEEYYQQVNKKIPEKEKIKGMSIKRK